MCCSVDRYTLQVAAVLGGPSRSNLLVACEICSIHPIFFSKRQEAKFSYSQAFRKNSFGVSQFGELVLRFVWPFLHAQPEGSQRKSGRTLTFEKQHVLLKFREQLKSSILTFSAISSAQDQRSSEITFSSDKRRVLLRIRSSLSRTATR